MLIPMLSLRVCGGGGGDRGGLLQHRCRCRGGGMNVQWQLHRCLGAIGRRHSQRTAGAGHSATPAVDTGRSLPRVAPPSNSCRDSGPVLALGPRVTSSHGIPPSTLFSGHHQHTNNTPITRYIYLLPSSDKDTHTRRALPSRADPERSQCHDALGQLISECRPSMHLPPYPSYIPYSVYLFKPFFIRAEPSASRMTLQSSDGPRGNAP